MAHFRLKSGYSYVFVLVGSVAKRARTASFFDKDCRLTARILPRAKMAVRYVSIGVARIFDWGAQITCNDVIENFENGILCGGKDIVE